MSGGAGVGTAGEPGTTPSRTIAAYEKDVSHALCELEVRCGSMSAVDRCMEFRNSLRANVALRGYEEVAYDRYFAGVDLVAYLEHEYRLADDVTLDACLSAIAAAACDRAMTFTPKECAHVLVPNAPGGDGDPCDPPSPYFQARPCSDGLECKCGVCSPARERMPEGSPCDEWDDCESGLQCRLRESGMRTCGRAPRVGELCDGAAQCSDGGCVNERCVPFAGMGEHCGDDAYCQLDLACNGGTCVASAGVTGDSCSREDGQCLLWCVFDTPDSPGGTCGVPSTIGPSPCASYADDPGELCPVGTYSDERDDGDTYSCNCLPRVPLGGACNDDYGAGAPTYRPCASGFCLDGLCQPQRENGAACSSGNECSSWSCDVTSGTCVPLACTP